MLQIQKALLMKRFTQLILLFLCPLMCNTLIAEESIEGAFGKFLGDYFDPKSATGKSALTDGTPMYRFNPKNPYRAFNSYFVMITPKSNRIFSIWAIGGFDNSSKAKNEQSVLLKVLESKYGSKGKQDLFSALYDSESINHGDRYILTKVSGVFDVTLEVRYYDKKLKEVAEEERLEIESNKVDSSGL